MPSKVNKIMIYVELGKPHIHPTLDLTQEQSQDLVLQDGTVM